MISLEPMRNMSAPSQSPEPMEPQPSGTGGQATNQPSGPGRQPGEGRHALGRHAPAGMPPALHTKRVDEQGRQRTSHVYVVGRHKHNLQLLVTFGPLRGAAAAAVTGSRTAKEAWQTTAPSHHSPQSTANKEPVAPAAGTTGPTGAHTSEWASYSRSAGSRRSCGRFQHHPSPQSQHPEVQGRTCKVVVPVMKPKAYSPCRGCRTTTHSLPVHHAAEKWGVQRLSLACWRHPPPHPPPRACHLPPATHHPKPSRAQQAGGWRPATHARTHARTHTGWLADF